MREAGRSEDERVAAVLAATFPFFALILIGFLAARGGLLPLAAVPGLNVFVLYFALTAMLYDFGARTPIAEFLDPVVLGVWLLAGLVVLTLGVLPARRAGHTWLDASFGGLIAIIPNSGFMGIPLLTSLFGDAAAGPIIASLLVDIIVFQSLALTLAHRGQSDRGVLPELLVAARRMASNPLPWAIALGCLAGWVDLDLPTPVQTTIEMLAQAASPAALFTIGAVLARAQMTPRPRTPGRGAGADIGWLSALKLLAHPLAMWTVGTAAIAAGLGLAPVALAVLVLTAALPSAANISVLAERFGADNGRIARVILVSTVLSFGTFTAAAGLLR